MTTETKHTTDRKYVTGAIIVPTQTLTGATTATLFARPGTISPPSDGYKVSPLWPEGSGSQAN